MPKRIWGLALPGLLAAAVAGCRASGAGHDAFDIVVQGGRVMDPESGLDTPANLGIRGGRIERISDEPLTGTRTIDASGLVVAPGFIDLHAHGQSDENFRLMAHDGVTSAFELEVGTGDVAAWYAARAPGQLLNYGVSVGHIPVRMAVMEDPGVFLPSGPASREPASPEQIAEMERRIEAGLRDGAVAVGFGLAYTPAASRAEFESLLRIAAAHDASAHIHVRGASSVSDRGLDGLIEAIDGAAAAGAALHVVHVNSSGGAATAAFLERIERARRDGQDVTTEAYPYEAGMTGIQSALFDDWQSWDDARFGTIQSVETGERFTRATFSRARTTGGFVIIHSRTEEMTRTAIEHPLSMIASDGAIENGRGHPRTSGSYAKVLGRYVREGQALSLMDALRKMTIEPARRLERRVEAMKAKGRLRVGADADLTIFDPATVIDRSTYTEPTRTSEGIAYVLVNGVVVVDAGKLVSEVRPGRPVRAR